MAKTKKKTKANGAAKVPPKKKATAAHAKANGKSVELRKGVERSRYTKKLPVPVKPEAVRKAAEEMAQNIHKIRDIKDERREAMAEFKERLVGLEERQAALATTVEESTELRDVPCVERLVVETNTIEVHRLDREKDTLVDTRPAEGTDRQEVLDLDAKADKSDDDELPDDFEDDDEATTAAAPNGAGENHTDVGESFGGEAP